jgi:predicted DNA-binding ribbon-helix-helix protein
LNGFATCLRLEEVYWEVLSDISRINKCSINTLLSYIDLEVHLRHGGVKNFSGFIRVVCVMHLLKMGRGLQEVKQQQVFAG